MSSSGLSLDFSFTLNLQPPSVIQGVRPRSHHYAPKSMWQKLLGEKERQAQREIINLDLSSWFWVTDLISGAG